MKALVAKLLFLSPLIATALTRDLFTSKNHLKVTLTAKTKDDLDQLQSKISLELADKIFEEVTHSFLDRDTMKKKTNFHFSSSENIADIEKIWTDYLFDVRSQS